MQERNLTELEEKSLIGLLYNHVTFATTMQIFGEADGENIRVNTLRNTLEKLLVKYNLLNPLAPDVLLLMGITNHISHEQLKTWASDDNNKHLQLRAKYFLSHSTK